MSVAQMKSDINAKCAEIEERLSNIKQCTPCTFDSKWLDDVRAEALKSIDDLCEILEIIAIEQSVRLAEYDKKCGLVSAMYNVLFPHGENSEVANE